MLATDEEGLICDLAEYYNIYDYKAFKPSFISLLAGGLSNDSRIKRKLSAQDYSLEELILIGIYDRLSWLLYAQTKDAQKGINKPKNLFDQLIHKEKEIASFNSVEEFKTKLEKLKRR